MGVLDVFRRKENTPVMTSEEKQPKVIVGADASADTILIQTFSNSNITYQGNLEGFNYDGILRDKQNRIKDLYSLSDYFIDADPIYRGTIKHVYVPFSLLPKWNLTGADEKTRQKYLDYYKRIRFDKKLKSFMLQYYKYGNVFIYRMEDGSLISLPVTLCKVTNVTLNGEPLVEYDLTELKNNFSGFGSNDQRYFQDNEQKKQLLGYPAEVGKALVAGLDKCQLNPENTYVFQDVKEDWNRYAIPMVASFLPALSKKALIKQYEDALLNLALRAFVHVKYGDPDSGHDFMPDVAALNSVRKIFSKAMNGNPLAVTNPWADAQIIQAKSDFLFQEDKYREVNNDLLSAGGISGVIVTGVSQDGSTFASAQVSMQAAVARIEQALTTFAEMMTTMNERIYPLIAGRKNGKAPVFEFMPLDPAGRQKMQEACMKLWKEGVMSTKTMMNSYGYDAEHELALREKEDSSGMTESLIPREAYREEKNTDSEAPPSEATEETRGRDTLDDSERTSDPENAIRGRQAKPSNPEGSMSKVDEVTV